MKNNKNKNFYEKDGVYGSCLDIKGIKRFEKILEIIKIEKPKKMLDAGCGDGFFAQIIKNKLSIDIFGIDISQKAVNIAKERGIIAKRADLEGILPFQNEYFDLIYCGEVIEHIVNPDNTIKEFHRILKKNGILVLSTPNLACWYNRFLLLLGIQPVFAEVSTLNKNLGRIRVSRFFEKTIQPVGHLHIYTLKAAKYFLEMHGFKIEKVKGVPFLSNGFLSIFDKSFSFFPSFATILIIKARKADISIKV